MFIPAAVALAALIPSALAADFDPEFYANPWTGVCASGMMQTPVDLPADVGSLPGLPEDLLTDVKMPVVSAPVTKNTGHSLQVLWDPASAFDMTDDTIFPMVAAGGDRIADAMLTGAAPEYTLKMIPLQIHWHVTSEHSFGGLLAPMEAHIVTAVGPGEAPADWGCDAVWEGGDPVLEKCIAVFGIVYVTSPDAEVPDYMTKIFDSVDQVAGAESSYPDATFDLMSLLPDDLSHTAYVGSLTTPPCSEGLRWHVFTEKIPISIETVMHFEEIMANITDIDTGDRQLYRHNNRPVQPLNGRTLYQYGGFGGGAYGE